MIDQERLIADLRGENTRLKGLNGRLRLKPSVSAGREDRWLPRVAGEDRVIKAQVLGSRFTGYETFVVQDIVLRAEAIDCR